MTLKKVDPKRVCYAPGTYICWVCGDFKKKSLFTFDKQACNQCVKEDLENTIKELEAKLTKKKPGRPKKEDK